MVQAGEEHAENQVEVEEGNVEEDNEVLEDEELDSIPPAPFSLSASIEENPKVTKQNELYH